MGKELSFLRGENIWDTRGPCGPVALLPVTPTSITYYAAAPVSQWPKTTRWRRTNEQERRRRTNERTNEQTGRRHRVKFPPKRGLKNQALSLINN